MPRRFKERFRIFFSGGGGCCSEPRPTASCSSHESAEPGGSLPDRNYSRRAGVGSKSTPQHLLLRLLNSIYKGFSWCRKLPNFRTLAFRRTGWGVRAVWPLPVLVPGWQWFPAWHTRHLFLLNPRVSVIQSENPYHHHVGAASALTATPAPRATSTAF